MAGLPRNVAFQKDPFAFDFGIGDRHSRQQRFGIGVISGAKT